MLPDFLLLSLEPRQSDCFRGSKVVRTEKKHTLRSGGDCMNVNDSVGGFLASAASIRNSVLYWQSLHMPGPKDDEWNFK